ncbi:MAG: hypothetical protein BGO97_00440 [Micrococcales bacterium 70-64]|nr:hypothetical protein [Leifsonia sp.]ODU65699.1 MAG: hypothetical protein ABT06_00440 [Leifsonia sp. SCN 70-46]OJX84326.1 MAG: hypothetical protein BGO97_00440 [Micrococcales bacterium 70-64]
MTELAPPTEQTTTRPVSPLARRALLFALIPLGVNILVGILNKVFESASGTDADLAYGAASLAYVVLYALTRTVVVALVVVSFIAAGGAVRQIRTGECRGLPRTVFAILLDTYLLVFVVVGLVVLVGALLTGAP